MTESCPADSFTRADSYSGVTGQGQVKLSGGLVAESGVDMEIGSQRVHTCRYRDPCNLHKGQVLWATGDSDKTLLQLVQLIYFREQIKA